MIITEACSQIKLKLLTKRGIMLLKAWEWVDQELLVTVKDTINQISVVDNKDKLTITVNTMTLHVAIICL
jgi:predicted Rdx family selenoprotein